MLVADLHILQRGYSMNTKKYYEFVIRFISICIAIILFAVVPVRADSKVPSDIVAYLKNMKSAAGRFTQIGPDGVISEGEFALRKPGKMYFDYADPTPLRVISDGFWVAVEDVKLKTQDRYPLSETPLSVLLSESPDFSGTDYKIAVNDTAESYLINASDPKHPERGDITLAFSKETVALTHWIVTDSQGLKTIVNLQNVSLNVPTKNNLFFIETENGGKR
jgi:outer membrane lipoprotein-sorting protein